LLLKFEESSIAAELVPIAVSAVGIAGMSTTVNKAKYKISHIGAIVQNIIGALTAEPPVTASLTWAKFTGCLVTVSTARFIVAQNTDHTTEIF
jgi:hypothetical protein